jgi:hypothetical protein
MTVTNFETQSIEQAAGAVREFRRRLIDRAGFGIANSAGELANEENGVWVATTYAGGEYELVVWTRDDTDRNRDRRIFRVTAQLLQAHPGYLEDIFLHVVRGAQADYDGPGLRP